MFSLIRNRFGIPGVISVVALVFAMAGGAFAANNLKGHGSGATASAKGKVGPKGPKGPKGAKGDTGAPGAPGAAGAAGKEGPAGKEGKAGKEGPEGSPWTVGGVLPSGEIETGVWNLPLGGVAEESSVGVPLSFNIPLEAELEAADFEFIKKSGPSTTNCPGTVSAPEAALGKMCVYEANHIGAEFHEVSSLNPGKTFSAGVGISGALVNFATEGAGNAVALAFGTWAVGGP